MTRDINPSKVFHSPTVDKHKNVHIVLVRPEEPGNVGSIARVMANMGIVTPLRIVGSPEILSEQAYRLAKHAKAILEQAQFYSSMADGLTNGFNKEKLSIATTAETGSPERPHPIPVREAMERATTKLVYSEIQDLILVFGPEGDGLTNEEVRSCDWIATIPSVSAYRSLNLSQATLVFSYEFHMAMLKTSQQLAGLPKSAFAPSQKQRLISHMLRVAEDVGFILPGDPFKMRPRLEGIFSKIPVYVKEATTLHGLLDQISRSVKKGEPDMKGRYRNVLGKSSKEVGENGRVE